MSNTDNNSLYEARLVRMTGEADKIFEFIHISLISTSN